MTMHADQLVGATVTDSDGLPVGTVEQVFRDDVDGTPSWARIRSATGLHFVPLAGSKITRGGGLCVPFDSRRILGEPRISVDRHMSVEQEEQLRQHFGIRVPPQPSRAEAQAMQAQKEKVESGEGKAGEPLGAKSLGGKEPGSTEPGSTEPGRTGPGRTGPGSTEPGSTELGREAQGRKRLADESLAGQARQQPGEWGSDWVIRSEERIAVDLETRESGRVTVRKYVDAEPVQRTVRVFHEELEIERVPISEEDQVTGDMAESEQEIILHEARAKITKETFPVERVRLCVRKVEEDKTVSGEIRKERIEVVDDGSATKPPRQ